MGPVAASLVLSVSGLFYFARLVEQNLREVPKGVISGLRNGCFPRGIICRVLLNEARAGMVSSITVLAIGLLSYSAAAGMIGGGGWATLPSVAATTPLSNGSHHLHRRHPGFTRYPDSRYRQQICHANWTTLNKPGRLKWTYYFQTACSLFRTY